MAEARIVAERDRFGHERGTAPKREIVIANFNRSAEDGFEAMREFALEAGVVDQQGDDNPGKPDYENEGDRIGRPAEPAPLRNVGFGGLRWHCDGIDHGKTFSQFCGICAGAGVEDG